MRLSYWLVFSGNTFISTNIIGRHSHIYNIGLCLSWVWQPCNLSVLVKCKCRKRPRIKVMSFWICTRWIHEVGKPQFLKLLSLTRMEYDSELCLNPRQGFGSTPKLRECPLPLISFAWHFYSIVNIVSEFLARFVVHLLNLEIIFLL